MSSKTFSAPTILSVVVCFNKSLTRGESFLKASKVSSALSDEDFYISFAGNIYYSHVMPLLNEKTTIYFRCHCVHHQRHYSIMTYMLIIAIDEKFPVCFAVIKMKLRIAVLVELSELFNLDWIFFKVCDCREIISCQKVTKFGVCNLHLRRPDASVTLNTLDPLYFVNHLLFQIIFIMD